MYISKPGILTFIFLTLSVLIFPMCDFSGDSEEISKALTNRMTDCLNFEGGEIEDSLPPEENETMLYPQIVSISAVDELTVYRNFSVTINHDADSSNIIFGVMAWVNGSEQYIRIPMESSKSSNHMIMAATRTDDTITISGYLESDDDLIGKTFGIYFALFGENEMTGKRVKWKVKVVNEQYDYEDGDDNNEDGDDNNSNYLGIPEDEQIECPQSDSPVNCSTDEYSTFVGQLDTMQEGGSFDQCYAGCNEQFGIDENGNPDYPEDFDSEAYAKCISDCYNNAYAGLDHDLWNRCYGCIIYRYWNTYDTPQEAYDAADSAFPAQMEDSY